MRWEALFHDLEAQFAGLAELDTEAEIADRTRAELGRLRLGDRLRAHLGTPVVLRVLGAGSVSGRLSGVGPDWLLVRQPVETLVATAAVTSCTGPSSKALPPGSEGGLAARFGLPHLLLALVRDRAPVAVSLRDGRLLTGTLQRMALDHFDLAEHPADEPPRPGAVRAVHLVPVAALAALRRG